MEENRRSARMASRLRCWCEGENITVYARIGNLSEGGIFLRTSTPLERGSSATLRFGANGVETTARVVWSRADGQGGPPGMGLAFENIDERAQEEIRRLLVDDAAHAGSSPMLEQVASN